MVIGPHEPQVVACPHFIYDGFHALINHPWSLYIFSSLLIFGHALLINRMVIKNRLSRELTQIPGMVYAFICSIFLSQLDMFSILFANTFLIIGLQQLFNLNKHPKPSIPLSLAGFFTAIAGVLYFPYTLLVILSISAINGLRSISFRSIFQYLLAFLSVFVILGSYLFWLEKLSFFFSEQWFANLSIMFDFLNWKTFDWIGFALVIAIQLIFLLFFNEFIKKKGLAARKKISILFQWQALCILATLMVCLIEPSSITVLALSTSVFVTMMYLTSKNKFIYEILHFVCLALILNHHFSFYPFNFSSLF